MKYLIVLIFTSLYLTCCDRQVKEASKNQPILIYPKEIDSIATSYIPDMKKWKYEVYHPFVKSADQDPYLDSTLYLVKYYSINKDSSKNNEGLLSLSADLRVNAFFATQTDTVGFYK